jgi:hypothetical protein
LGKNLDLVSLGVARASPLGLSFLGKIPTDQKKTTKYTGLNVVSLQEKKKVFSAPIMPKLKRSGQTERL